MVDTSFTVFTSDLTGPSVSEIRGGVITDVGSCPPKERFPDWSDVSKKVVLKMLYTTSSCG